MLKVYDIKKRYKTKVVLNGINLHVKKGEIKALIGVNGAGKSTLIDIICGVKKADFGEVYIDDKKTTDKNYSKQIKFLFGYMPQMFSLFNDLTVKENLEYLSIVYNLPKENINRVIDICSLKNYEKQVAKTLSGGYKQMLSLAAAILHSPKLLILDEPTSAMDPIFRKKFWQIIKDQQKNGVTTFVVTHLIEEILNCNSFAMIKNGKVCIDDKVENYINNGFIDSDLITQNYGESNGKKD